MPDPMAVALWQGQRCHYRPLIERVISQSVRRVLCGEACLKRAYGLARCVWRGFDHFKAYVWSSVVAYNLALCARMTLAKT